MLKYITLFVFNFYSIAQVILPQYVNYNSVGYGASLTELYFPLLKSKKVGVVTNASGMVFTTHLVDTLLKSGVNVIKVFSPEHGFRGTADAGVQIETTKDDKTGLPLISLYGKKKKPSADDLKDVDVLLFDIQDVGVRFYTYLSTLHYVMEACAEQKKMLIVLDRPNPNGFYIDGPVMKKEFRSFLGLHPVPIVYGMTIGEYALMINGERWLSGGKQCSLKVIPCRNYNRNTTFVLPVPPSPNLNSPEAVLLYPTLGLLEGSQASVGRGTPYPFRCIAHPDYPDTQYCFVPLPNQVSKNPKYSGMKCCGADLSQTTYLSDHPCELQLSWITDFIRRLGKENFFTKDFEYHAGNAELRKQLLSGNPQESIRNTWKKEIADFKKIRSKYLLYPDVTHFRKHKF
jgi:uncharacterized protein YbbC (DUF1343 family)